MLNLSQYYPTNIGLETLVYKTGNQSISGVKNFFSRPTVNGTGVLLSGELVNAQLQDALSSERYLYHTFAGGNSNTLQVSTGRNFVIDLTFETTGECNVLLPNPASGGIQTGDRLLFSIVSISGANQNIPLNFRTNLFQNNTYSNYTGIFSLNLVEINDGVEFIYKGQEWKIRFPTIGKPLPYAHSHNAAQVAFSGNRTVTRIGLPSFIGGDNLETFLNNYFFPFQPAVISLNSYTLRELGTTYEQVPFTGSITQNNETQISNLQYLNGNTVLNTITNPNFGNFSSNFTLNLVNDATLSVRVNTNNNGSPTPITASQLVKFEAPMYYGAGIPGMSESQIKLNLLKQVETKSDKTRSFTGINQKLYIVVPSGWGLFTKITDPNGFPNINGWGYRTATFTLSPNPIQQNYYIWETLNLNTVNNFNLTFAF